MIIIIIALKSDSSGTLVGWGCNGRKQATGSQDWTLFPSRPPPGPPSEEVMNLLGLWKPQRSWKSDVWPQSLEKSRPIRMGVCFRWIIWNARVDVGGVGRRRREAHVVEMFVLFAKYCHFSRVAHRPRLSGGGLLHHGSLHLRSPGYFIHSFNSYANQLTINQLISSKSSMTAHSRNQTSIGCYRKVRTR